jgi:ubiquinol-cytochrome c reductase cytochrome c subunit
MSERRRFAGAVVLGIAATVLALVGRGATDAGASAGAPAPASATTATSVSPERVRTGEELFLTGCVSCHGAGGVGTTNGPPLLGAGEASADFYLRTGRMPLAEPSAQPPDKRVAYSDEQIRALVAYVGSLCNQNISPCLPVPDVDPARGDLRLGGQLFLANCAPCHNSVAVGGALSYGGNAPSLQGTHPTQVAEAIRIGPGQMPEFGGFTDEEVDSLVRYVQYLHQPDHPGGASLGYTGPVAEGFVALLLGLGLLLLAVRWITRESRRPRPEAVPLPTDIAAEIRS